MAGTIDCSNLHQWLVQRKTSSGVAHVKNNEKSRKACLVKKRMKELELFGVEAKKEMQVLKHVKFGHLEFGYKAEGKPAL